MRVKDQDGSDEMIQTWGAYTYVKKMISEYEKMFGEPVPKRKNISSPLEEGDPQSLIQATYVALKTQRSTCRWSAPCNGLLP